MSIWAAIIMGLFLYAGSTFLMQNIVTGTSTSEGVAVFLVPLVLGLVVVGVVIRVFRS